MQIRIYVKVVMSFGFLFKEVINVVLDRTHSSKTLKRRKYSIWIVRNLH